MRIKHSRKLAAALLASLVFAACASADTTNSTGVSNSQPPSAIAEPPAAADSNSDTAPVETAAAEVADQTVQYFVDDSGLAIRGTDPVAYFTQGGPVAGSSEFTYTWNNATWQFASAENRDLFVANPEQYAPQYGGFCAWAVSQGYTAAIDPNAWSIVDGKLYLNFNQGVQRRWERDIPGNINKADANWPGVLADS